MVFTTLDFAERYLLKTEVGISGAMTESRHDDNDRPASDGPMASHHHYADLH